MRVACRSGSPSSLDTPAHHSVTNEPQELRSIGSIIREKSNVDRRRFGVTARVSLDVPIWAFGRCSRQPSWRAKRFCAGIGPLKPCVAGVYPACRKTGRSSRLPADIPHGSARSGEIVGRFGDRGAPNGSRLWPSIDMACSRTRSSCAFVRRPSLGRGSVAAG